VIIWVHVLLVEQNSSKLEDSRQRTQNLINVLSHDISTPLTVISVKLNHLIKTPLSELQLNSVARAYKATERVIQITESIKELRLTELGKKEITYGDIDLREMILELKEIFADRLDQKNIRFNWSVSSEVYSFISSRSLILNQILGNLLSNAIKFSTPGSEIRLRISKLDHGIQFLLEDSGLGIPKDMRENIFEANLSRSCVGTNGEVGTGFGLPIVKGCVDRLNGKIAFETKTSHEGPPGTRFKLFFPT
jgi:signal transduction histidine kinase